MIATIVTCLAVGLVVGVVVIVIAALRNLDELDNLGDLSAEEAAAADMIGAAYDAREER